MKKGIIFDMDGTLWDSASSVAECWSNVLQNKYDGVRVVTEEDLQSVMGLTMDNLAKALFPKVEEGLRLQMLNDCCDAENRYLEKYGAALYEGLEEVLEQLHEEYHLYIVSNCQSGYIEAFLSYYGFGHFFDDIECFGNNHLKKGENIRNIVERNQLAKAVYVGDIQGDYDASCEAKVEFIHAAYGFGNVQQDVERIQSLMELPACVNKIFRKAN